MNNLVITNAGQELVTKMLAGTSTCTFTKVKTSDHDYSGVELTQLTALDSIKQTSLVSSIKVTSTTMVELVAMFNNQELQTGYPIKAIGIFAKGTDGTEILYAVAIDPTTPDYLPPNTEAAHGITYTINTKVDASSQVVIEIDPAAVPSMNMIKNLESTVDGLVKQETVILTHAGWTGESGSMRQTISSPFFKGGNYDYRMAVNPSQLPAFAKSFIYIESIRDGEVIFVCPKTIPASDITVILTRTEIR